ncbi:ectomycorrhizas-regulated small secreted protein [Ephemerocybe angulata]|uniref:Ectomycorrhizas-regulated small secreted protein n=1 Tax=Ephemerocybe angulata TaxID=980116 RepID=A0A8H6LWX8_9AGAR|nr:ectomycorrhizas-regulated small secreted protein [Tulosesus angulatus]
MRVSLPTLLSVAISLASIVNAHQDQTLEARDYVDKLTAREVAYTDLERRDLFADISTRELIDELSDRLERRGRYYVCNDCGMKWSWRSDGERTSCKKSKTGRHEVIEGRY